MKPAAIRDYLGGGDRRDRRSIGRANELVKMVERQPSLLPELVEEMWNPDPVIAMRAADATEKLSREHADGLLRFKKEFLGLAGETQQQELRWHLAAMLPRLQLSPAEQRRAVAIFVQYLGDKSSIVKTFALQGLFDLSLRDRALRPRLEELLRSAQRAGTAAMRARARKLLARATRGWS
jgi:hypothetical protein